jgi:hypothetical protein
MGINGKNTARACVLAYGVGATTAGVTSGILYMLWVQLADLPSPMLFHGYLTGVVTWYAMNAVFWFECPKNWRNVARNKKRIIFCLVFLNLLFVFEISYKLIQRLFLVIPKHMHWPLIIVLLVARELHAWVLGYFGQKIAGVPDLSVEVLATVYAGLRHAIFLSVDGASMTTDAIGYTILAADFLINLLCCFIIIWCDRNESVKNQERKVKALLNLISNEYVEFAIPITYVICLLMAYFGPNAEILGNVRNGFWHYNAIEDIGDTLKWITIMFSFDFVSLILSTLLLRYFCKINIFRMYLQIQDQMGHMIVLATGYMVSEVKQY